MNFGEYVRQLANELCTSYAIASNLVGVTIEAEEIELPVHRAIPCGLIMNELVSNSLKYGFPDSRRGQITVHLFQLGSGGISLSCWGRRCPVFRKASTGGIRNRWDFGSFRF